MPSSLVFAALVVAWLVILVPMIARRRQAVTRTAEAELAARVVRRPGRSRAGEVDEVDEDRVPEAPPELPPVAPAAPAGTDAGELGTIEPESERPEDEPQRPPRRYRPGRGGFDPEAAALAARARYTHRQRAVLALLAIAVLSAVGAALLIPSMWWLHGTVDVLLVGYLGYLRRQVRIEDEIRQRRAARLDGGHRPARQERASDVELPDNDVETDDETAEPVAAVDRPAAPVHPAGCVVVDSDADPAFHDLADRHPVYRRAVGE